MLLDWTVLEGRKYDAPYRHQFQVRFFFKTPSAKVGQSGYGFWRSGWFGQSCVISEKFRFFTVLSGICWVAVGSNGWRNQRLDAVGPCVVNSFTSPIWGRSLNRTSKVFLAIVLHRLGTEIFGFQWGKNNKQVSNSKEKCTHTHTHAYIYTQYSILYIYICINSIQPGYYNSILPSLPQWPRPLWCVLQWSWLFRASVRVAMLSSCPRDSVVETVWGTPNCQNGRVCFSKDLGDTKKNLSFLYIYIMRMRRNNDRFYFFFLGEEVQYFYIWSATEL